MKSLKIFLSVLLLWFGVAVPQYEAQAQLIINPYAFGALDSDAQAFITATGITDNTQKTAINTLVVDLKANGLWTKFNAIYPFVGGSAATHKYNLKDPRDLDAAFRLTFSGTWTHSSTGADPNGSTGYANTYLTPSSTLSQNDKHISYYSRETGTTGSLMGCVDGSARGDMLQPNASGSGDNYSSMSCVTNSKSTGTTTSGLHLVTRTLSTDFRYFRNGGSKYTETTTSSYNSAYPIYIGAKNFTNSATQFTSFECAFATIGSGLSDAEVATMYTIIQAFETSLARQL